MFANKKTLSLFMIKKPNSTESIHIYKVLLIYNNK